MRPSLSILRGTVAKRILGLFLVCALLPIGSLAVLSLWEMTGSLKEQTDRRLHQASKNVNTGILQGLYSLKGELEVLSLSPEGLLRQSSGVPGKTALSSPNQHFLGLTRFRAGSPAKTLFGTPSPPPPPTDGIGKHLADGNAYLFVREVPGAPPRLYLAVSSGRRTPGEDLLVGEIHPKYLGEIIENVMPAETDLTVLDSSGAVLYGQKPLSADITGRVVDEARGTHAGQFEWTGGGDTVLVNYRSIFLQGQYLSGNWTVVVSQAKADAFAAVTTFTKTFVLIIVLTLLVILFLSIVQIRRNLDPLERLREGTQKISQGEFDSRVAIRSDDEFEELALSFNTMAEHLGIQFRAISEANRRMEQEIAERKKAEEQLLQAQKMEAVGQLTGGIAHDFNNLLTVINGYSGIALQRLGADDPIRKDIEGIGSAGERAASLVNQLLTFSRKKVLEPKVVNLNESFSGIDMILRRLTGEQIDLAVIRGKDLGSVRVDPGQIEQVVMNLTINARDAMPDGGELTIETANRDIDGTDDSPVPSLPPGKYVAITVRDTGCGMDEKTRSRVFEPFFTTKPPGKGTGLGLSTVYGIVKQSQGHIILDSEVGKGATFTVYLPRVEDTGREADISDRSHKEAAGGTETLLVAEDEDLVRDLVRSILVARGYKVLAAKDGKESLEIGSRHEGTIHLLVTDMSMPNMNGGELAQRLAEVRPGMKTLYMSGYMEDSENGNNGLPPDAIFIQKPFRPDALARKVREVLDG
ncbi:MAG: ATP-binding protein [Deltaproteobacteria bacterium]|nr:ATP-binding protein [Deltaproteobacteria bacterium]